MNSDAPHFSIKSFVGTWQLESFTETLRDGRIVEPMGKKPQGFLLYTQDGIVSAQLSGDSGGADDDSSEELGRTGETRRTAPYIGYCGKFTVNSDRQEVVHSPAVAHDDKLIGLALHRHFRIDSDRLTLRTLAGEAGTDIVEARLVWLRYRPI